MTGRLLGIMEEVRVQRQLAQVLFPTMASENTTLVTNKGHNWQHLLEEILADAHFLANARGQPSQMLVWDVMFKLMRMEQQPSMVYGSLRRGVTPEGWVQDARARFFEMVHWQSTLTQCINEFLDNVVLDLRDARVSLVDTWARRAMRREVA